MHWVWILTLGVCVGAVSRPLLVKGFWGVVGAALNLIGIGGPQG